MRSSARCASSSTLVGYGFKTHVSELSELRWHALDRSTGSVIEPPPPELIAVSRPTPVPE